MRGYLSLWLIVLVAAAAVMPHETTAQTPSDTGTIVVQLFRDLNGDGKPSNSHERLVARDCRVLVLNQVPRHTLLPNALLGSDELPVLATATPNVEGIVTFDLPVGRYTVISKDCFPQGTGDILLIDGSVEPCFCPNTDLSPPGDVVEDSLGNPVFAQPVEVRGGETTQVTVIGYLYGPTNRTKVFLVALACLGLVIIGAVFASLWRLRPRYAPKSDPDNPKAYVPTMPEERPADFDDVFGEFLKKKDND